MTDEEMLEYCKDNYSFAITSEESWDNVKMVFKDGYKQGQKENASLLKENKKLADRYIEKRNEVAELKDSIKEYREAFLLTSENNDKLRNQIEKMKCCGNCKHYLQADNYHIGLCREKYDVEGNNYCDNWELAE